jgi:hypothetical protein
VPTTFDRFLEFYQPRSPWIEFVMQHDTPDIAHLHADIAGVVERKDGCFAQNFSIGCTVG